MHDLAAYSVKLSRGFVFGPTPRARLPSLAQIARGRLLPLRLWMERGGSDTSLTQTGLACLALAPWLLQSALPGAG